VADVADAAGAVDFLADVMVATGDGFATRSGRSRKPGGIMANGARAVVQSAAISVQLPRIMPN